MNIADFTLASFIFNIWKNDIGKFKDAIAPALVGFPHIDDYSKRLQTELASHLNTRVKFDI
jgi:hypothetical protein